LKRYIGPSAEARSSCRQSVASLSLIASADRLFADLAAQCLDQGELAAPFADGLIIADQVTELGDVLINPGKGRNSDAEITIANLTGLAAQDIAMAQLVMTARARG
jgi:ornithine cyclodeaminase